MSSSMSNVPPACTLPLPSTIARWAEGKGSPLVCAVSLALRVRATAYVMQGTLTASSLSLSLSLALHTYTHSALENTAPPPPVSLSSLIRYSFKKHTPLGRAPRLRTHGETERKRRRGKGREEGRKIVSKGPSTLEGTRTLP